MTGSANLKSFRIISADGHSIAPGVIIREDAPHAGERICIFNYPDVLYFIVEQLETRADWWEHDWDQPVRMVLRREAISAPILRPAVRSHDRDHIASRLTAVYDVALAELPEKTALHISHTDYVALCDFEGISIEMQTVFAAIAYYDLPMKVGRPGDEGTLFDGHGSPDDNGGDYGLFYVTRRDGTPFRIDQAILNVVWDVKSGKVTSETATGRLFKMIVPPSFSRASRRTLARLVECLELLEEGIMTPRLVAQELTDMRLSFTDIAGLDR